MAYKPMVNYGHKLSYKVSGTYQLVVGVQEIKWEGQKAGEIDNTDQDSTSHKHLAGRTDKGNLKFKLKLDLEDTVHKAIFDAMNAGSNDQYLKVELNRGMATNPIIEQIGFFTTFPVDGIQNQDGLVTTEVTFKINTMTYTAGVA